MQGTGMEKEKRGGLRLGPRKRTEAPMRWEQTGRDGGANVSEGTRKWERGKSPERDPVQDNTRFGWRVAKRAACWWWAWVFLKCG